MDEAHRRFLLYKNGKVSTVSYASYKEQPIFSRENASCLLLPRASKKGGLAAGISVGRKLEKEGLNGYHIERERGSQGGGNVR